MKTTREVYEKIKEFEGLRLTAYKCPAGVLTIGYGHTGGVKLGMTITKTQAEKYLKEDIENIEKKVDTILNKRCLTGLNIYQYSSLVSFTFNCGSTNLTKLTKDRTVEQIGKAITLYNKSNGKALQGLVNRRQWESDYFFRQEKIELAFSNFLFKVKGNYRIRKTPNGTIIGSTVDGEYLQVKTMIDTWVETEKGWIHIDAFYFKLK